MGCFAELPAELQIEVFSYLDRPDLKSVRSVSLKFRDHASPTLFNKVVACARYHALGAMQKVSVHPAYQTYVKEIVFDGSVYDQRLASSWERYRARATRTGISEISWEVMTRYRRYKELYDDQEDMRTGGVLLAEVSRALQWMPNISSLVYSPGPRDIPIERKKMRDLVPRGVVDQRFTADDRYIESSQRGIHHIIGAIYASQYSGIREFRVETPDASQSGTEFTIHTFDFPDPRHLDAGRFFFRNLYRIEIHISVCLPGTFSTNVNDRANAPPNLAPGFVPHGPHQAANAAPFPGNVGPPMQHNPHLIHPPSDRARAQLSNLSALLSEAKELRNLSFHLTHWQPAANQMYGHLMINPQYIFGHLGLNAEWPKLRSLSLGGVHATEEELLGLIKRHERLEELEFQHCSLLLGSWSNIVDEVLDNIRISSFSLKKVHEIAVDDTAFEGDLKVNSGGLRYFDEPEGTTVYSSRRQSADEE